MCSTATLMNRYGTPQMAPISPNRIQAPAPVVMPGVSGGDRWSLGRSASGGVSVVSCSSVGCLDGGQPLGLAADRGLEHVAHEAGVAEARGSRGSASITSASAQRAALVEVVASSLALIDSKIATSSSVV